MAFTLTAKVDTAKAREMLAKVERAVQPAAIDAVVERVALKTFRDVVVATPKRWFGQVRRGWQIRKPADGARVIVNENKVMLFLEEGTRDHGPVTKRALYIPLNRYAALGWHPGLKWGEDFVLAKRVRGIKAMHIAKRLSEQAQKDLLAAMKAHVRQALAA